MVAKTTDAGREYGIDGKKFLWYPLDDDDKPTEKAITIPLRIKLGILRGLGGVEMDATGMFLMLEKLIPRQAKALDDMDLNDFQDMFTTWQVEYEALSGASLGKSDSSST